MERPAMIRFIDLTRPSPGCSDPDDGQIFKASVTAVEFLLVFAFGAVMFGVGWLLGWTVATIF
jgi:hypothetical protein